MKLWTCHDYDPEQWNTNFAFLPKAMSNGAVIWLETYEERATNILNYAGWDWEYRRIK